MTSKGRVHNPFLDLEADVDDGEEMSEDDEAQEPEDDEAQEAEDDVAQDDEAEDDEVEVGEAAGDDIAMHLLYSAMAREDDEDDDDVVELTHQYQERAHRGRESASRDHAVEAEERPPLPNEHCPGIWMLRTKSLADQDENQNAVDEPRSHSVYSIFVSENQSCIDEADRIYVEAKSMHDILKISSVVSHLILSMPAIDLVYVEEVKEECIIVWHIQSVVQSILHRVYGPHTVQEQMPDQDNGMKMYMFKKKLFKDGLLCVSCEVEQLRLLDGTPNWVYFASLAIDDHVRVTEGELQGIKGIIQSIIGESVEVAYGPSQSQVAVQDTKVRMSSWVLQYDWLLQYSVKAHRKNRATYQHFVLKRAMISWGQYKAHKGFIKDEYNGVYQMELDAPRGVVVWLKPSEFRYLSDQQDTLPLGYATSSIPSSSGIPLASQDISATPPWVSDTSDDQSNEPLAAAWDPSSRDPSSTGDNPTDQYAALTLHPQDNTLFLFHPWVQKMLPILKRLTLTICNTKGTSPEAQWEQGQYEDKGVTVCLKELIESNTDHIRVKAYG
ncbi:uncharacterized protein LAESUDRAFT_717715 [Laetiporus sulphureus 93-53]|uniref:Uncharacterized protein n=1 Tax=Laetiporus sulphureus 93-53 TaxID=1314785 RepID=A0A165BI23_9APHY|nr:uncharacterized protein LAESUDRAFT_717715 [Laetiporus sulphureus 93-53]KZT01100.1 hypothetical protein LAESUDRAFT_717715 [Laetiporus sulphureus 93-53]